jgi:4-hydroxybenzoate polyprenyltransferase
MSVDLVQTRSRGRAYLLVARVSNLPTVWSDVLAGTEAGAAMQHGSLTWTTLALLVLSASAFYTGGMFLNDAFDAPFDRRVRPERPVPRGEVGVTEAFTVGGGLLALGLGLVAANGTALVVGVCLAAAIVFYDARHKGSAVAPLVMGACRGLVYLLAATTGTIGPAAWAGAGVMLVYVAGLTVVAKRAGADARWLIPALIAGISIVDAIFILVVDPASVQLAAMAALGCPLTLALQRWVPGD